MTWTSSVSSRLGGIEFLRSEELVLHFLSVILASERSSVSELLK